MARFTFPGGTWLETAESACTGETKPRSGFWITRLKRLCEDMSLRAESHIGGLAPLAYSLVVENRAAYLGVRCPSPELPRVFARYSVHLP